MSRTTAKVSESPLLLRWAGAVVAPPIVFFGGINTVTPTRPLPVGTIKPHFNQSFGQFPIMPICLIPVERMWGSIPEDGSVGSIELNRV